MTTVHASEPTPIGLSASDVHARQTWMALLARSQTHVLEKAWSAFGDKPEYTVLRAPEAGMVMVRARAGGEGSKFNLGEMTVTRCVVRTARGHLGHAYVAGRDKRHAMLAAVFDALMQDPEQCAQIEASLLHPIRESLNQKRSETARKVAATRVDFFTLVRGND
jgi:alpha-D-ribose 1-methylphosphonate 5-triphosphate synthase subunit PhnG